MTDTKDPKMTVPEKATTSPEPLLKVSGLVKHFPIKKGLLQRQSGAVQAVDGLDFDVRPGETLGVVGESGCGKSTMGRLITRLLEPTSGTIEFEGKDITHLNTAQMRPMRRDVQMIFQDPYSSLNPRHTVGAIVSAPFRLQGVTPRAGSRRRSSGCWRWSGSIPSTTTAIRTSSPAVSGSASASPGRWPSSPSWSWPTSRSRRWTCRSRRRWSTCWTTSRTSWA
ncbi:hypothetical protein SVIO_074800 [Streptomyces violaceusniger]|uniref:ABC transporter domain-containing protein n=1 Tax=Streptomyces violaceusniger TaxID=68280 RepID=A0A4D4LEC7_STRVO|nr:hypothetical protein SVIO_074800 [Streptomyces violaceusniger]